MKLLYVCVVVLVSLSTTQRTPYDAPFVM